MNERYEQFDPGTYEGKSYLLSEYADISLLEKQRQKHAESGVVLPYEDVSYSIDTISEELAEEFTPRLLDTPDKIFVSAFTVPATEELPNGKRTLLMMLSSREVQTEYRLDYDSSKIQSISFEKSVSRIYGDREFDRYGDQLPESAMEEIVSVNEPVSDDEIEVLYAVLSHFNREIK